MNNPITLWLIIGFGLCSLEFFVPTAFVEFMMGVGAIAVAIACFLLKLSPNAQIALWLIFSTAAVIASRRFLTPKTSKRVLSDAPEAETLTAIAAGKAGRVLYEGNSWRAKCADETIDIPPNEVVYVVRQEGTTLYILPRYSLS